jgi:hypothetical protein
MLSYIGVIVSLIAIIVVVYFLYVALNKLKEKFSSKVLVEYVFASGAAIVLNLHLYGILFLPSFRKRQISKTSTVLLAENKTLEIMFNVRGFPHVQKNVDGRVIQMRLVTRKAFKLL